MITKSEIMYIVETDKGYIVNCSCVYADDCLESVYVLEHTWNRTEATRYYDEDKTRKIAEHVNGKVHTLLVTENVEVVSDWNADQVKPYELKIDNPSNTELCINFEKRNKLWAEVHADLEKLDYGDRDTHI